MTNFVSFYGMLSKILLYFDCARKTKSINGLVAKGT